MPVLYLDSSALAKRYVAEAGSAHVAALMAPTAQNPLYIAVVSGAEMVSAFVRRQRRGELASDEVARAISEFRDDWASLYEVIGADRALIERAMLLAERHGLRGYDAVQLASALEVSVVSQSLQLPFMLVSADDELNAAAAVEGLPVDNPNSQP